MVYLIIGKAGAGKTTYAIKLAAEFKAEGKMPFILDGDVVRAVTNNEDFSNEGREEHLSRIAVIAKLAENQGLIPIIAVVCPKQEWRDMMRKYWGDSELIYLPGGELWDGTEFESPYDPTLRR